MRQPSKTLMLCLAASASLAFATPRNAHADAFAGDASPSVPCEQNPNITPSLRICAFQHDGIRHYQIDTRDGRHVRLAVVDGDIEVLPVGQETVRVALANAVTSASGVETVVYRDASLEIDTMQDPQNRLTWVVHPLASQAMCTGAGCNGGSHLPALQVSQDMCNKADCSGGHIQLN